MRDSMRLLDSDNPPRLLIVEGSEDFHTLMGLLKHHNVPQTFVVKEAGGISSLLKQWRIRLKANNETHIGIVVDADTDLEARWQSLRNSMVEAGYKTVPDTPDIEGTVIFENKTRVGIWLMPDNVVPGTLENFVRFLVPTNDLLWPRVEACVFAIPEEERLFPSQYLPKALIHTWLAWQKEPGLPMGQAISNTFLDANLPQAQTFVGWLQRLFELEG